jgi:signal transduction histidine kinase
MQRRNATFSILGTLVLALAPTFARAEGPTAKDAEELVQKASTYLKANGQEKLLQAVNTKDGEFHKGELYVFVYDQTATILAHPVNAKLVGRNTLEQPDVAGKFYRKDIIEIAKTKGKGWVDYKYKNPVSGKVEDKTSFVMAADAVILVAGVYK